MAALVPIIIFVIGWAVSTIIIYLVTKFFGEEEGIGRAALTAIIGAITYGVVYALAGNGIVAAIIGGLIWLFALKGLYDIGWVKALIIAGGIWIIATIVGLLLPTVPGPL